MTNLYIAASKRSSYSTHARSLSLQAVEEAALQACGLRPEQANRRTSSLAEAARYLQTGQVCLWEQASQPQPFSAAWVKEIDQELAAEKISRQRQDQFALTSEARAYAGWQNGWFKHEVLGQQMDTTIAAKIGYQVLAAYQPLSVGGTITLGNGEPPAGGAAVIVLVNEQALDRYRQLEPLARISAFAKNGLQDLPADLNKQEAIELAVPTAGQALSLQAKFGLTDAQLNPSGGLPALGYLQNNLLLSAVCELVNDLVELNAGHGLAAGQGAAAALRRIRL